MKNKKEAIKYIMSQLDDGYIDLSLHDKDELKIIREAMDLFIDKYKAYPCEEGTVVYYISLHQKCGNDDGYCKNKLCKHCEHIYYNLERIIFTKGYLHDFGKTVFLTRKEALQKIYELLEERDNFINKSN